MAPKVIVIVLDDVGKDMWDATFLPNLKALEDVSARLSNFWVMPNCSPTRSTIMTGKWPFRTGLGTAITSNNGLSLDPLQHPSIAMLVPPGLRKTFLGKWHLASIGDYSHPNSMGWDLYLGSIGNLNQDGANYFHWTLDSNGKVTTETSYATEFVARQGRRAMGVGKADLLFLSFNAPHIPLHFPPFGTYNVAVGNTPDSDTAAATQAMLQAVDFYVGAKILPFINLQETFVIVLSDNGSSQYFSANPERAKGTVYQQGINTPCFIAGPGIVPGDVEELASSVDLFATVIEMCGGVAPPGDSISLLPLLLGQPGATIRQWNFSEQFKPNFSPTLAAWQRAVRNQRFKLIQRSDGSEELYDLWDDPDESNQLPLAGPVYDNLRSLSDSLH